MKPFRLKTTLFSLCFFCVASSAAATTAVYMVEADSVNFSEDIRKGGSAFFLNGSNRLNSRIPELAFSHSLNMENFLFSDKLNAPQLRNQSGLALKVQLSHFSDHGPTWVERILVVAVDSFGSLNHFVDTTLSMKSEDGVKWSVIFRKESSIKHGLDAGQHPNERSSSQLLGLQVRVDW